MKSQTHLADLRRGSRGQPQARRNSILQSALAEFAREGLAGARMDAIAEAAGVNKALLYYYFRDKETLYGSILDRFFERLSKRVMAVCDRPGSAGERFLFYVRTHYDAVAESPYYAHIFMSELMSASRGGSPHLDRLFLSYMQPIGGRILELVAEGVQRGEFRAVDPNQFVPSAIGSIVHYFLTAPLRQKFMPGMDFSSAEAIQQRRAAVLDFIAAALFADREAGVALAADIAARPPASEQKMLEPSEVIRAGRSAASRSFQPASKQAPAPLDAAAFKSIDAPPYPPGGYLWYNRWFPNPETAALVLAVERGEKAERRRKRKSRKRRPQPSRPGKPGGPE